MEEDKSEIIFKIIFVAIFFGIMLVVSVLVITSLNSRDNTKILFGNVTSEVLNNVISSPQTLNAEGRLNPSCTITQVTDLNGTIIPTSNYTVNNCQITYIP